MSTLHQTLIDSILDDEGLTEGLTDNDAQVIINWCIKEIEKLLETPSTETEIKQQASKIKQKARLVCKIANDIQNGKDKSTIRKRLERFITNQDNLNRFLALAESNKKLLTEQIQRLLDMPNA